MEKYLITIEFRFDYVDKNGDDHYNTRTITVGIYDDIDKACEEGNKAIDVFKGKFKLNPNYNRVEKFSKNGGSFNSFKNLISNLTNFRTPFDFYAKITTLDFSPVNETIDNVLSEINTYSKKQS